MNWKTVYAAFGFENFPGCAYDADLNAAVGLAP